MTKRIAFVLKGYPRLSETFIAQEIHALEQRGLDLTIVSLRHPTDSKRHPVHEAITAPVVYLPEYLYQEAGRVFRAFRAVRKLPGYRDARRQWLKDLRRDRSPNRIRRFGQAMVVAHELGPTMDWLHAHFLHTPASVTRYAAMIANKPWSCSAHAKDIWTIEDWEKREKLEHMQWLVTCTKANAEHLSDLAPDPARVALVYHGLDLSRFKAADTADSNRDGTDAGNPVRIISVGRAVPKKGYDLLLEALARVPAELHWRFEHIGGGSELDALKLQAERLGLTPRIDWQGSQAQTAVIQRYREGDIFVLPSRITADGDRDGLPNVLMEAQSQGVACISTTISGIPELIEAGETGLLIPPEDVGALADALVKLIESPDERFRLGDAGRRRVNAVFDMRHGIDDLDRRFAASDS